MLDTTQNVCGPYCTQILFDLGAEIIKVEPPEGDVSRRSGTRHGSTSIPYIHFNRGKKSITLDLKKTEHRELYLRLAKSADIIVEDSGPGKMDALGIGYAEIIKSNPDIVYLAINGYGNDEKYSDYSDLDAIVQAMSGFMSVTGKVGGEFTKAGAPLADLYTGLYGVIGILAGIIYRKKTGDSLYIDIAKLSVMLTVMPDSLPKYLNTGELTRPNGNRHQMVAVFQPLRVKDGHVVCMATREPQFKAFAEELGMGWLAEDERFNDVYKRCKNIDELEAIIHSKTGQMAMDDLVEAMRRRRIPVGPVNTLEKILEDPYTKHHQLIMEVSDCVEGDFRVVGLPIRFEKFESMKYAMVSQPGEYTREVLKDVLGAETKEVAG